MKQSEYNGYKLGAAKRRFKTGKADLPPGALITKMNEQKKAALTNKTAPMSTTTKVAIMGAV